MSLDKHLAGLIAEKNAEIVRLTALLPPEPAAGQDWRVGTKVPVNVYAANRIAGQMQSPELAAHVVEAVNAWDWGSEDPEDRKVLDTVAVPRAAFALLVDVAAHVSRGRSFAFVGAYPDATARFALGALDDAGLLPKETDQP